MWSSAYVRINVYEETLCQTIRRHIPENSFQKLNPVYCLKLKNIRHLEMKFLNTKIMFDNFRASFRDLKANACKVYAILIITRHGDGISHLKGEWRKLLNREFQSIS
jgi:hypothetical protein